MVMIARRCLVAGRVQGVYYRATAARRAAELAITGLARNLPDGRVEVFAFGEPAALEQYLAWLWQGSEASLVESVTVEELSLDNRAVPPDFRTA